MPKLLTALKRFFISRDLALVLLAVFTIIACINMLGWQSISPLLKKDSFLAALLTYGFYISGILLCINLLACSIQRIWQQLKAKPAWGSLREKVLIERAAAADTVIKAEQVLISQGYKKIAGEGADSYFRKGYGGVWGSILYHVSLLVIVGGLFLLNTTRYDGTLFLTEGQSFSPGDELIKANDPEQVLTSDKTFKLTLKSFDITYQGDSAVKSAALMEVEEEGAAKRTEKIRINYPIQVQHINFMLTNFDYAPRFILTDKQGQPVLDGYVNLFINNGHEDSFQLPQMPVMVNVKLYPEANLIDGKPQVISSNPVKPLFWVQVKAGPQVMSEKYLRLGEPLETPVGTLKITDLSRFVQLIVTKEEGADILVFGFSLTLLGLLIRFFRNEKRIILNSGMADLVLMGQSEYYVNIYKEEFQQLSILIEEEVNK